MIFLFLLLFTAPLCGENWQFHTHPSSVLEQKVMKDWRDVEAIEVHLRLKEVPEPEAAPLYVNAFLKCHKSWWFESVEPLVLDGSEQVLYLRLDDESPDWETNSVRRPFAPDVLRWLDSWGLKTFSVDAHEGEIEVGEIKLIRAGTRSYEIRENILPSDAVAGSVSPIRFRLHSQTPDPYNRERVSARLVWERGSESGGCDAFYRQDFVELTAPYREEAKLVPLERPLWQANWRPDQSGEYHLRLEVTVDGRTSTEEIGRLTVTEQGENTERPALESYAHLHAAHPLPLYASAGNRWHPIEKEEHWSLPLDWIYAKRGLGEFSQENGWRLEREIEASGEQSHPLLLVSDAELTDDGRLRWTGHAFDEVDDYGRWYSDHEAFSGWEQTKRILVNRAHYLWNRYGASQGVSGLLIQLSEGPLSRIQELQEALPEIPLFAIHPALNETGTFLNSSDQYWKRHEQLGSPVVLNPRDDHLEIRGQAPGSFAVVSAAEVQHWAGASALSIDVKSAEGLGEEVKAQVLIRTAPHITYESRLVSIPDGKWNRLSFSLEDASEWVCWEEKGRHLQDWELLNIHELSVRFFVDHEAPVILSIGKSFITYPPNPSPLAIESAVAYRQELPCYEKYELDVELNRLFRNPYDPREIDLTLTVVAPDGKELVQPGFYYEPHALSLNDEGYEVANREGTPYWKVRITPRVPGAHHWTLRAKSGDETAEVTGAFLVRESEHPGFVEISQQDPRFFEYSDGTFYYPIGYCMRSPEDNQPLSFSKRTLAQAEAAGKVGTRAYERWFTSMEEVGANFARIWMSPWWCAIEWNPGYDGFHGYAYYNQENATRIDTLLESAERHNIRIQLDTMNHGQLSTYVNAEWFENPICDAQPGGFIHFATEAMTNDEALRLQKQRIRYILARWGYSPSVAFWGVVTEMEWMEPFSRALDGVKESSPEDHPNVPRPYRYAKDRQLGEEWVASMANAFREMDAHQHPVTSQFSWVNNMGTMWERPELEIICNNAYTPTAVQWGSTHHKGKKGVADAIFFYDQMFKGAQKPNLIAEWGGHYAFNREEHLVADFHTGLWSCYMTNLTGAAGYWWHNVIDSNNLFSHMSALKKFSEGEERRGSTHIPSRAHLRGLSDGRAGLILSDSTSLYGYLFHPNLNQYDTSTPAENFDDEQFPSSGEGRLQVPRQLENGRYRVEYWNTFTGEIFAEDEVALTSEEREVPIPDHRVDLALKVKKL